MAFINLTEAFPKEEGVYRVMVESTRKSAHEANARWHVGKGFQLVEGTLEDDAYIVSWWTDDNLR